jgi:hypothetical protein
MSEAIPLFPPRTFMVGTGITSPFFTNLIFKMDNSNGRITSVTFETVFFRFSICLRIVKLCVKGHEICFVPPEKLGCHERIILSYYAFGRTVVL